MHTEIRIDSDLILTKSSPNDKSALVKYLNDPEIYNQTLRIPYPYTETNAEATLNFNENFELKNGVRRNWAIRGDDHELMGHIGLHYPYGITSATNEIYYWLGKPFRNKGIMTRVIGYFTQYCFDELKFSRLEAPIFDFNTASEAVLKKNGFLLEKELPGHYNKND